MEYKMEELFYEKENGSMAFTEEALDYLSDLFVREENGEELNVYEIDILKQVKQKLDQIK